MMESIILKNKPENNNPLIPLEQIEDGEFFYNPLTELIYGKDVIGYFVFDDGRVYHELFEDKGEDLIEGTLVQRCDLICIADIRKR